MNDQYHGAFDLVVNTLAEMDRKDLIPLFKEAIHRFDLGCIKLTDSLWKKLPVVLNDAKHFQGLNVVDVGSMQGFSSFFLYVCGLGDSCGLSFSIIVSLFLVFSFSLSSRA